MKPHYYYLTLLALFSFCKTYSQKYDTSFYSNKSIKMVSTKIADKERVILFYTKEGNVLSQNDSFKYTYFDDSFSMDRTIIIESRDVLEEFWSSQTDTIYNKIKYDFPLLDQLRGYSTQISKNIKYPVYASSNEVEGRVIVSFIVNKYGEVSTIKPITSLGFGLEEEVISSIQHENYFGKIVYKGQPISLYIQAPYRFRLK